jgi:probable 2-oxoglutarate dehydrogenase E1 component DHKTD1
MYDKIRSRKSVPELYAEKLFVSQVALDLKFPVIFLQHDSDRLVDKAADTDLRSQCTSELDAQLGQAHEFVPTADMLTSRWSGLVWPADEAAIRHPETGVEIETLRQIGRASVGLPAGFVG